MGHAASQTLTGPQLFKKFPEFYIYKPKVHNPVHNSQPLCPYHPADKFTPAHSHPISDTF